jgi:GNAT superfamily N-acetyltransferase
MVLTVLTQASGSSTMFQIEPYATADLPVIEAFIEALHDAEREFMPILSPGVELAGAGLRQMLDDISADRGMALLAKSHGRPIGFGYVLFDDHRDPAYCEAERCRAYLSYLYVAAEWRRQGVGRALLTFMEAAARDRGCSRFVTRFKAVNTSARRCYEKAGFKPVELIVSKTISGRGHPGADA